MSHPCPAPARASRRGVFAITAAVTTALMLAVVAGCGGEPGTSASSGDKSATTTESITVVATIGMIADIAREVAGDRTEVVGLIRSGVDPHLYAATRSDVERLMSADVVFYNGLLLEGKMTDALMRAASSGRMVKAVTESLEPSLLLEPEEFEGLTDPHVWMDPARWTQAVDVVRDTLIEADPDGADGYRSRADAYKAELAELDAYAERVLASVPDGQRVLVSAHDAFNYFGDRFGYEVMAIQGLSTESEAGVLDIERLVDLLVERQIAAVFVESTISEKNVQALVAGAAARNHEVIIGGELFSDAMGDDGTYEGTYIGMIDHNVTTIARALGGEAPERGIRGELAE